MRLIPWYVKVMLANVGSRDVSLFFSSLFWPMGGSLLRGYLCILCVPACVARYLAHFNSVEVVNLSKELTIYLPQPTGCSIQSTQVLHNCTQTRTEALQADGRLLLARVDCGQASSKFQNLTLYEANRWCGRLSYRKYGNRSELEDPTAARIPWISNHLVTIKKGDVVDIQCVLLPFGFHVKTLQRHKNSAAIVESSWSVAVQIIQDGLMGPSHSFPFFRISLTHPASELESCTASLAKAYSWKMSLNKSMNYSHWVRYSSPALELSPSIFPEIDLCCERRGEIFTVDKDSLHLTVREGPSDSPIRPKKQQLVKLDQNFYAASTGFNSYALEFKLEVDARALPPGTKRVEVTLTVSLHRQFAWTTLTLPVNGTSSMSGLKSFESWVNWLMVLLILGFLVAAVCYVFREEREPEVTSCDALEMQSIWVKKGGVPKAPWTWIQEEYGLGMAGSYGILAACETPTFGRPQWQIQFETGFPGPGSRRGLGLRKWM